MPAPTTRKWLAEYVAESFIGLFAVCLMIAAVVQVWEAFYGQ